MSISPSPCLKNGTGWAARDGSTTQPLTPLQVVNAPSLSPRHDHDARLPLAHPIPPTGDPARGPVAHYQQRRDDPPTAQPAPAAPARAPPSLLPKLSAAIAAPT